MSPGFVYLFLCWNDQARPGNSHKSSATTIVPVTVASVVVTKIAGYACPIGMSEWLVVIRIVPE